MADNLKVLICDDSPHVAETLDGFTKKLADELGVSVETCIFADGAQLVDDYKGGADILLIDVEMPFLNGIDASFALREFDPKICIVFVTSFERYAVSGYRVGAYRYLVKPVTYELFREELRPAFLEAVERKSQLVTVRTKDGFSRMESRDILFAETLRNHRVLVHCRDGAVDAAISLAALEESLGEGPFFRCHRAFLINLEAVRGFDGSTIFLEGGASAPLSKHRSRDFKLAFSQTITKSAFSSSLGVEEA